MVRGADYSGILVIDKESGPTSHDVVACLRRLLNMRRIGHCGTLDPLATGVLVVCLGQYTRLSEWLSGAEKEYLATFQLDAVSDTADLQGAVHRYSGCIPPLRKAIEDTLKDMHGAITQIPPAFSAVKVSGVPSYRLARQQKAVPLPARQVYIRHFQIIDYAFPFLKVRIACSKGTYVRALAVDLGKRLGCGGLVTQLRRMRAGNLQEQDALSLSQVAESVNHDQLSESFIAPRRALDGLSEVILSEMQVQTFTKGNALQVEGIDQSGSEAICAVYDLYGRFYGIGEWNDKRLSPRKVFCPDPCQVQVNSDPSLPVSVIGRVEHGQARGQKLGFPTANLKVCSNIEETVAQGVFAGWVEWEGNVLRRAVINIGTCPTFDGKKLSFEVHILEFAGDLYGVTLRVTLVAKLRNERRFTGTEELLAQIRSDVERARAILKGGIK